MVIAAGRRAPGGVMQLYRFKWSRCSDSAGAGNCHACSTAANATRTTLSTGQVRSDCCVTRARK